MWIEYHKRFRMEARLKDPPPTGKLPPGYRWVPWDGHLMNEHAIVHYHAFCEELDSEVFPAFAQQSGCRGLLEEITQRDGFLPQATWLIADVDGYCGAVQGLISSKNRGSIQNIGVLPAHRRKGLGKALTLRALKAFWDKGVKHIRLEVTVGNEAALSLYRGLGFRRIKTVYKAAV